ncbi:MAG: hypothetical protein ISQ14_06710 [Verrucomicrobiae bacterium]|nr:hypothetical protein [Verrucomicrobiae bacterium]
MRFDLPAIAAAAALFAACGAKDAPPGTNPVNAPTDYLGAVAKGKKKSESTLGALQVAPVIQQFEAAEGRFPKSLQEMVDKGYLSALPEAPQGMKASYDPQTGAFSFTPAK